MNPEYETSVNVAIGQGDWSLVLQEARRWSEQLECGPLPFFALNVVHMLRGNFSDAWKMYPRAFGEEADIQLVREWMDRLPIFC